MMQPAILKKIPVKDNRGFTLLEALIALCIFSIGILATASMQATSINSETLSRQNTEAAAYAASVIENLHPLNYQEDAELTEGNQVLPVQEQYNISYTVQRDAIVSNTMLIQVTVSWNVNGVQKNVNLISIKPDII